MANFLLYSRHQVSLHVCSFFGSSQTEKVASLKRSDYASSRHKFGDLIRHHACRDVVVADP